MCGATALPGLQTRASGVPLGATTTEGCSFPPTIKRFFVSNSWKESSACLYSQVYAAPLTRIVPASLAIAGSAPCATSLAEAVVSNAPVLSWTNVRRFKGPKISPHANVCTPREEGKHATTSDTLRDPSPYFASGSCRQMQGRCRSFQHRSPVPGCSPRA